MKLQMRLLPQQEISIDRFSIFSMLSKWITQWINIQQNKTTDKNNSDCYTLYSNISLLICITFICNYPHKFIYFYVITDKTFQCDTLIVKITAFFPYYLKTDAKCFLEVNLTGYQSSFTQTFFHPILFIFSILFHFLLKRARVSFLVMHINTISKLSYCQKEV